MITFELNKEQELIVKTAKEFAAREMRDIARDCDEDAEVPTKILNKAWEMGLANAAVPETFGGIGMQRSAMTSVLICEELAYGCASLATAIMAPSAFIHPLIDFGTDDQQKKYLPMYGGDQFAPAAVAVQEPRFTFDCTDMHTTAEKKGGEWILNGAKRLGKKLVDLWTKRFETMAFDEKIKYVFIFENRGEAVGVTMPHPHGQIYGYPFIPKKIELELDASRAHYDESGKCLVCDMSTEEKRFGKRVVFENNDFIVFLPFYTEYPYGVYIVSKRHACNLLDFTEDEKMSLAKAIRDTVGTLDSLFDIKFPYMMCMHQTPVNSGCHADYYHFHMEFFPPMRSADKLKFNASSETGAWAHCNTTSPEDKAAELQNAYLKFKRKTEDTAGE
ncbi:MAG: galactose-1-phosphate uridylyltransferase [Clostridia bacterium]